MSDLIRRQDAIKCCRNEWEEEVEERLRLLPSAQRKGKWIYNSPVTMQCNLCGFKIKDWDWSKFNYCPNCGARMEGE